MAIKILIDSASDMSLKEAQDLGVYFLPMEIRFGNEEYLDGVNLLPEEFYDKLIESDVMPQTSQINPFRWEEEFNKLTADGSQVIAITISSKLSGTYTSACVAAEKFKDKVFVLDSMSAAVGERHLCYYAIELVKKGLSIADIMAELEEKKGKLRIMAMLGTLEYLRRGGRISAAVALAGSLLSIKPVVAVIDGEVKLIGKAMGSKKANNLLTSFIEKSGGIDFDMPVSVIWSGKDKSLLDKYVEDNAKIWQDYRGELPYYQIGSTIGTHVGPGAIGVCFFEK
ncbi:MAG: DegV family protein [Clostridia bacterium]|nr:DegV family protein [Clostridia bacterium]